jgi:STE24 endopeptidase
LAGDAGDGIGARARARLGVLKSLRAGALAAAAAAWAASAYALWQTRVPDDLDAHAEVGRYFTPAQLARAADFERFVRIDTVAAIVVLLAVLALYARHGARFARESAAGRIGTGMLLAMLGLALVWLAQLPFGLLSLWWERRHGVSRQGYVDGAVANWLSLGGEFLFVSFAVLIVMALARPLRDRWWVAGGPFFVGLVALFVFVQPYLLPATHPLRDRTLAADVRRRARREGLSGVPVEVQEVHTFTTAPNAEATGLGGTRRIVLWDTLLDGRFSRPEIRLVVAHEIAHLARNHLPKLIAWYALFAVPGAYLIALATRRRGGMYEPRAVPLGLFVLVALQLAATPLQSAITRHVEAEADWVALGATRDPVAARSVFRRLAITARQEPSPPTWDYVLFETHPTIAQRIGMVNAWERRQRRP